LKKERPKPVTILADQKLRDRLERSSGLTSAPARRTFRR
jgi:hypothetical protein